MHEGQSPVYKHDLAQMQIDLHSPVRRLAFAAVCLLIAGLDLTLAARAFWASHLATAPGVTDIERAIRLEPSNSEYREVLARNLALSIASLDQEIAGAKIAWDHLIGLHQSFDPKPALPFLRLLIAGHEVAAASKAWQQLATIDDQIRPYVASPANLIVNGGFEETLLNGGFDWW